MTRPAAAVVLAGWVLLMGGPSGGWRPLGTYEQEWLCAHVRSAAIDRAAVAEIGGAPGGQPPGKPLRPGAGPRGPGPSGAPPPPAGGWRPPPPHPRPPAGQATG